MVEGERVERGNVSVTDEKKVIWWQVFGLQLARLAFGFHGHVCVVHALEVNMLHSLPNGLVPIDAPELLVVEQEDADVEDVGNYNECADLACLLVVVVSEDAEAVDKKGAQSHEPLGFE